MIPLFDGELLKTPGFGLPACEIAFWFTVLTILSV